MRIAWALPCRYVEVNSGMATIVGTEANIFFSPEFPAEIGVMMAVKIATDEDDRDEHQFSTQVLGPNMQPVTDRLEATFDMGPVNPLKPAGWEQGIMVPAAIAFAAPEPGQYTVVLGVDDRTFSVTIGVYEPPPQPAP